jgi:hypothetical protein
MALGAVDDGFSGGVPGDFLEGERMAEQVFRKPLAPVVVICGDEVVTAVVNVKSGDVKGQTLSARERIRDPLIQQISFGHL